MVVKQPLIKSHVYQPLPLFISSVILLSVTKESISQYGALAMEVSPTSLEGAKNTTEATFTLANSQKSADLTPYQVRINLTEAGGTGSSLSCLDATKTTRVITSELQVSLGHFLPVQSSSQMKAHSKSPLRLFQAQR